METYNIFNKDEEHLYVLKVNKTKDAVTYSLFASHAREWENSVKGSLLMEVSNTGNGLSFAKQIQKTIDYLDAEYLRIILSIDEINSTQDKQPRLRIVREKEVIIL